MRAILPLRVRISIGLTLIAALAVGLSALPLTAAAQTPAKVWRIGLLDYASDPATSTRWNALGLTFAPSVLAQADQIIPR